VSLAKACALLGAVLLLASAVLLLPHLVILPPAPAEPVVRIRHENITYIVDQAFLLVNHLNRTVREYVYMSVPKNTSFQRSFLLHSIFDLIFKENEDGNPIAFAEVEVEPGGRLWVNVTFEVWVSKYRVEFEGIPWPSPEVVSLGTAPKHYWPAKNASFVELSRFLVGRETDYIHAVRGIGEWVRTNLKYTIAPRRGASRAVHLIGGRLRVVGDCEEAADVFVTIARAGGIPARVAWGVILMRDEERMWLNLTRKIDERVLEHWGGHAWPQVYVEGFDWVDVEMLEQRPTSVGSFLHVHVIYGVEDRRYMGTVEGRFLASSYLTLEYIELWFKPRR